MALLTFLTLAGQQKAPPQTPEVSAADYRLLQRRHLVFPVPEVNPKSISDTFNEIRGKGGRHEATDIPAPTGARVVAVDNGIVKKLFLSARGGLTVYQFDSTGAYCYYYAHLERYAAGLKEEDFLKRGDLVRYVDSTGDASASAPHLHFAIFKLGPEKHWWQGTPLDPFPILTAGGGK